MNIVVVSFYQTVPPVSGAAVVTYNLMRYLKGERALLQVSDEKRGERTVEDWKCFNYRISPRNRLAKAVSLMGQFRVMISKIGELAPRIVVLEGASWTVYYLAFLYLLHFRRIHASVIYHAHNLEYLLRKNNNSPWISAATRWAERCLVRKAKLTAAVSKVDARHFQRLYRVAPVLLPNGADVGRFADVSAEDVSRIKNTYSLEGRTVLFMGLPAYRPNAEAIAFLRDTFPLLVARYPDAKLVITGGEVGFKKPWLLNPGIIPFPEMPAFIKACDVCVAPIFSGSGTRLKILEYMAAGKPVVATVKAAEGIPVEDQKHILLADNSEEFVRAVARMLDSGGEAEAIGTAGRALVEEQFSWAKIVGDFAKLIAPLAGDQT